MPTSTARRLARSIWLLILACWLGYYGLWLVGGFGPFGPVLDQGQFARGEPLVMLAWCGALLAGASIAALLAARHPANPIGWLLFVAAGMVSLFTFAGEYGVMPVLRPDLPWPGAVGLVWLAGTLNQASAVVAPLLLFFPDGRLLGRVGPHQRFLLAQQLAHPGRLGRVDRAGHDGDPRAAAPVHSSAGTTGQHPWCRPPDGREPDRRVRG